MSSDMYPNLTPNCLKLSKTFIMEKDTKRKS